mmetsp:Transcript_102159/g.295587  ORF Transcript_102159/g.295587 Transcript_102159/m.295587 type:complete len:366 (-) Transcript_102159:70-1167(-)
MGASQTCTCADNDRKSGAAAGDLIKDEAVPIGDVAIHSGAPGPSLVSDSNEGASARGTPRSSRLSSTPRSSPQGSNSKPVAFTEHCDSPAHAVSQDSLATYRTNGTSSEGGLQRFQRCGRAVGAGVRLGKLLAAGAIDVPPLQCAISFEALNEFNRQAKERMGAEYDTATVRDIRSAIIRPNCDTDGQCYARTLNDDKPCSGQVFVCHCWDQRFSEFFDAISNTFRHWTCKPNLWISLFALVQTQRRTPCRRPSDAPFAAALKAANAIMVVEGTQVDVYGRLWTLWEMYLASKLGKLEREEGLLVASTAQAAGPASCASAVDSRLAGVTDPDDGASIRAAIEAEEGGYGGVNDVATMIRARRGRS